MQPWPLCGREAQLEQLRRLRRDRRSVVLAGPAGVGKSRLAAEVAAESDGACWIRATHGLGAVPFGAFAHLLDGVDGAGDPLALMRSFTTAIERSGVDTVVVDDVHLLDERSLALVHHLTGVADLAVLAAVRDRDDAPPAVREMWKDDRACLVDLEPLGPAPVGEMLAAVLGGPVAADTVERLHTLTRGNPLLLRETVRSALADGHLADVGGTWRWSGLGRPSTELVDAVRGRFATMPGASSAPVDAADLLAFGEPLPMELLRVAGAGDGVEALESAGLVEIDGKGMVRFSHPLFGEVLSASPGVARRASVCARLAAVADPPAVPDVPDVRGDGRGDDSPTDASSTDPRTRSSSWQVSLDPLRVALWRLEGGLPWPPQRWIDAAAMANHRLAHTTAVDLAARGLECGAGVEANLQMGAALVGLGRFDEADDHLRVAEAAAIGDDQIVDLAVARYFVRSARTGFDPTIADDIEAAERRVQNPDARAFLQAQRATVLCFGGDLEAGEEVVGEALATVQGRRDDAATGVVLRTVIPRSTTAILRGRTSDAEKLCAELLEPAMRLRDAVPGAPAWAATSLLTAQIVGERLDDAAATLELLRTLAEDPGWSEDFRQRSRRFLTLSGARIDAMRGRVPDALVAFESALADLREPTERTDVTWSASTAPAGGQLPLETPLFAEMAAAAQRPDLAAQATRLVATVNRAWPVFGTVELIASAWATAARGATAAAADAALDASAVAEERGTYTVAVNAAHAAARLGGGERATAVLDRLVPLVDLARAPLYLRNARALVDGDGDELNAVASGFEALGALLLAAESADAAADALTRGGAPQAARRAAARASALFERCGGVRPPWVTPVDAPIALTRREREVVALAAEGLTAAAIAERLFVARRTVEGHLLRSYQKLGVTSREELTRLVAERRTPRT